MIFVRSKQNHDLGMGFRASPLPKKVISWEQKTTRCNCGSTQLAHKDSTNEEYLSFVDVCELKQLLSPSTSGCFLGACWLYQTFPNHQTCLITTALNETNICDAFQDFPIDSHTLAVGRWGSSRWLQAEISLPCARRCESNTISFKHTNQSEWLRGQTTPRAL